MPRPDVQAHAQAHVMNRAIPYRARIAWPPVIALAAIGTIAVVAIWPVPQSHGTAVVIASRQLRFVDEPSGGIAIIDVANGLQAGEIVNTSDGFVPGVLHGMSVARKRYRVDPGTPYRLTELSDGRVLLTDAPTKSEVDLESFGRGNAASFAAFLHTKEMAPRETPK